MCRLTFFVLSDEASIDMSSGNHLTLPLIGPAEEAPTSYRYFIRAMADPASPQLGETGAMGQKQRQDVGGSYNIGALRGPRARNKCPLSVTLVTIWCPVGNQKPGRGGRLWRDVQAAASVDRRAGSMRPTTRCWSTTLTQKHPIWVITEGHSANNLTI